LRTGYAHARYIVIKVSIRAKALLVITESFVKAVGSAGDYTAASRQHGLRTGHDPLPAPGAGICDPAIRLADDPVPADQDSQDV
jgi:hypothetical protein